MLSLNLSKFGMKEEAKTNELPLLYYIPNDKKI